MSFNQYYWLFLIQDFPFQYFLMFYYIFVYICDRLYVLYVYLMLILKLKIWKFLWIMFHLEWFIELFNNFTKYCILHLLIFNFILWNQSWVQSFQYYSIYLQRISKFVHMSHPSNMNPLIFPFILFLH